MRAAPFACVLIACALAACNNSHADRPLLPDVNSPVSDVPVPAGFTLMGDSTSKSVPAERSRWIDHRYKGGDDVLPVANFYLAELPKHGWNLLDESQANGKEMTLHFQNAREDCTVNVSKHTFNTQIHIHLEPLKTAS